MSNLGTVVTLEHAGMNFVIYVEYTPYDPGVSRGPVEVCYPPEGGELMDWHFVEAEVFDIDAFNLDDLPSQDELLDEALELALKQEEECDLY